jgi:predicted glycoside hydrolase/deacetylase ChbG (UPF0249 family)
MSVLIVNADDFGQSDDTVDATIECFEAGALTSATLMTAMPATDRAIEFALERPEHSYGVHLTFARDPVEKPLSDPALVSTLVDDAGRLLSTRLVRAKAAAHLLDIGQIEREIEAQVRFVLDRGVPVSHVDSHRHIHKLAPFREAFARVLPRLGIAKVRTAQDVYLTAARRRPTYWLSGYWGSRLSRGFETTQHFFMASRDDPPWADALARAIPRLAGSLEVGVHPGHDEPWRDRDRESAIELLGALNEDVTLVNWRTLPSVR